MTARTINVRLPEALYNQIEELAKATSRTKSFLAIDALTHYVQSESWQIRDIHEGIKEADAGEFATDKQVTLAVIEYTGICPLSGISIVPAGQYLPSLGNVI
jgi:RHH-type transcriptional regulator, rel operon repressor / antitoxin RelB